MLSHDDQGDLFTIPAKTHLQKKFEIYDAENPHVYPMFIQYARQVLRSGHDKFSAKAIFERLRWHFNFETEGDVFKLNNNYTAFYARKAMEDYPEFKDFFELRERMKHE